MNQDNSSLAVAIIVAIVFVGSVLCLAFLFGVAPAVKERVPVVSESSAVLQSKDTSLPADLPWRYNYLAGDHLVFSVKEYGVESEEYYCQFSLPEELHEDLEQGMLSSRIREECRLSANAVVEAQKKGEWRIIDRDADCQYLVLKQENALKIYRKANTFSLYITGKLHQKVYQVENDTMWLGIALEKPTVDILVGGQQAKPEVIEHYNDSLSGEVYLTMSPCGSISEWFFPKTVLPELCNNLKSLALNTQLVFPQQPCPSWQNEESDLTGAYLAYYTARKLDAFVAHSEALMVTKQKIRYRDFSGKLAPEIVSNATAEFDTDKGQVKLFTLHEQVRFGYGNTLSQGRVTLRLQFLERTHEPLLAQNFSAARIREQYRLSTSAQGEGEENADVKRWERTLGTMKWEDFTREFAALKVEENYERRNEVFRKLSALMELHPEQIPLVVREILGTTAVDLDVCTMLDALGNVKNPAAQKALSEIVQKSENNPDMMSRAIASLGGVEDPARETVQLLQHIYDKNQNQEVHTAASLALGEVAGQMRGTAEAQTISYNLEKSLEKTGNADEQRALLDALGNAGSDSSLPHIENFLSSPDDTLRATAASALRFVHDERADGMLSTALLTDNSPAVRYQALDAMSYRTARPSKACFSALAQSIEKEAMDEMRIKEATLLWSMREKFPQAETIVRKYAANDTSPNVRRALEMLMTLE